MKITKKIKPFRKEFKQHKGVHGQINRANKKITRWWQLVAECKMVSRFICVVFCNSYWNLSIQCCYGLWFLNVRKSWQEIRALVSNFLKLTMKCLICIIGPVIHRLTHSLGWLESRPSVGVIWIKIIVTYGPAARRLLLILNPNSVWKMSLQSISLQLSHTLTGKACCENGRQRSVQNLKQKIWL